MGIWENFVKSNEEWMSPRLLLKSTLNSFAGQMIGKFASKLLGKVFAGGTAK